jgi:signal peptidase I
MSDVSIEAGAPRTAPLITFWLSPRQTIERIVAERPRHLVVPLIMLGGAGSAANVLLGYGTGSEIIGWRTLLACAVGAAVFAVFNFYVLAVFTGWVGRKIGGVASNDAVRAAFAWGMLPNIVGLGFVLLVAAGWRMFATGAEPELISSLFNLVYGICALWGLVVTLLMLARVERFGFWRAIVAYAVGTLVLAIWLALMVRTFLFQPFNVPASSMAPTVLPGDYIFVAKYPYGYTRFSLPFSPPLFSGRILGAVPARGDVIVFRLPKDTSTDYVKRVVGLPGDRIQMKEGMLYINGTAVKRERIADLEDSDVCGDKPSKLKRWRETLPEGASYETLDCVDRGFYDDTNVFTVPPGYLFMLGDNRDNSTDSRVLSAVGYIPVENVIGRVGLIFFSRDAGGNGRPPAVRYERIGTVVP